MVKSEFGGPIMIGGNEEEGLLSDLMMKPGTMPIMKIGQPSLFQYGTLLIVLS